MMCLKKPSRIPRFSLVAFITLLIVSFACSEHKAPSGVVAKAGDEYLTESELNAALKKDSTKYRQEYIRDWLETRMLYQEAKRNNLTESADYKRLVEDDKAKIAAALALQRYSEENPVEAEESELKEYFHKHAKEFALRDEAFAFNYAEFSNKISAENFRYVAMAKDWKSALKFAEKAGSLANQKENVFLRKHEFGDVGMQRMLAEMSPGEISIVFPSERKTFTVVQLIAKFSKGEIPYFDFLKKEVRERFLILKRKELLKNYIRDLYSKYNVEIYR